MRFVRYLRWFRYLSACSQEQTAFSHPFTTRWIFSNMNGRYGAEKAMSVRVEVR